MKIKKLPCDECRQLKKQLYEIGDRLLCYRCYGNKFIGESTSQKKILYYCIVCNANIVETEDGICSLCSLFTPQERIKQAGSEIRDLQEKLEKSKHDIKKSVNKYYYTLDRIGKIVDMQLIKKYGKESGDFIREVDNLIKDIIGKFK